MFLTFVINEEDEYRKDNYNSEINIEKKTYCNEDFKKIEKIQ